MIGKEDKAWAKQRLIIKSLKDALRKAQEEITRLTNLLKDRE